MGGPLPLVLVLAVFLATPGVVAAQRASGEMDAIVAEERARSAEARRHFTEGRAHYEAREFEAAVTSFEAAAAIVPSADLWFNIARAQEQLGRYGDAAESYRRYLRDSVDPYGAEALEARIAQLEAADAASRQAPEASGEGRLVIDADRAGAEVRIDGSAHGTTPAPEPFVLDQQRYSLELAEEGRVPFRADVRVTAGMTTNAYGTLPPLTEYRTVVRRRVATWVLSGLAVASLGVSIGLGVHAVVLKSDNDLSGARSFARYSDFGTAGTVTFGVGAIIAYFLEGRASRTERVTPVEESP